MKQPRESSTPRREASSSEGASQFLYERIYLELKEEIHSGVYAAGDWFPPERALKERFGTTHLTVRNALAKLVQEGYIERHSGKGTIVIYMKGRRGTSRPPLRFSHAQLLAADLDDATAALAESIDAQLKRIGLTLHVALHRDDPQLERRLYASAVESRALVILRPADSPDSIAGRDADLGDSILIGTNPSLGGGPLFLLDVAVGCRDAVRHLADLGYRDIAFVAQPKEEAARLREGWEVEQAARGIDVDPGLILTSADGVGPAAGATAALLARRPSCRAFLCGSDRIAAGVASALRKAGIKPGTDAAVVGFGDTALAEALGMTSIDPRLDSIGELLMGMVADGMRRGKLQPDVHRILPRLVCRDSTGRPRSST